MHHSPLTDIAICVVAAWLFGVVAQVLRQPVLLAYLVAGYVIGPNTFKVVTSEESIDSIASLGLILLLFVIGLEIDLKRIIGSGRAIMVTALAQIIGTAALAFGLLSGLRPEIFGGQFTYLYLAMAAFVSSTVIAVKLLADKRQLDTLAGRLTIGISVIQDVAVISFLGLQPALAHPSAGVIGLTFAKIAALIGAALGASRYLLPPLFRRVATLPELVVVGAMAWCFVVAGAASKLGLSPEMGALVAGVSLSTFPYHLDVIAKITGLRDFFITLFFVGLGLRVPAPEAGPLVAGVALVLFVLASRGLTVFFPLRFLGLGNRMSFLTAIYLLPLSEFSLVLVRMGEQAGHLPPTVFPPVVYAFFILAVVGSYAISGADGLFRWAEPALKRVGLRDRASQGPDIEADGRKPDVFLLGFSWTASSLLEEILLRKPDWRHRVAVIDFNPEVHQRLVGRGIRAIWGDISQRETLNHAGVGEASIVVCSLPNLVLQGTNNLRLVNLVRSLNPQAKIIAHSELLGDVAKLKEAGASYVVVSRLHEADDLLAAIEATDHHLLADKLAGVEQRISGRAEVIP
ncbi:MAG: cation:proton antiporter [Verrucomicrobiales bacterium]|nr:cation:proton antiporter [Verrucomicrobiales bacterium]